MARVTVITPTYNREETLPRTIESVLSQTFEDFEYLIIDDASTDDTEAVVNSYDDGRIKYIKHESNMRQAAARNTGLEEANGEYVAFIDSDDEWHPRKLAEQLSVIEERDDEWVGVYCDSTTLRTSRIKDIITRLFPYEIRREGSEELMREILAMQGNISAGSSLLVRTDIARDKRGFDESLPRHEDIDFVLRLLQNGKLAYVDQELVIVHESPDPTAELVEESKKVLLNKFNNEIKRVESEGYPVRKYHRFHLARCHLRDGNIRTGIAYLRGSRASNPRQYLRLCVAAIQGGRKRLFNVFLD
ncbi:glycosyltransferase AglE [Halolamina pelagica]|uniref:Glycosyltransferase AglE n=1 Tax=Halolamina pelagica TaxID=699431 RepID=A0A0P7HYP2_9EURY|nr:glycosyltransferase family A protein [Halolamina pelagica]KPN29439.1 glycosyltransferase AglE [Halolamina pelagica]